jgi:hypothetical protein
VVQCKYDIHAWGPTWTSTLLFKDHEGAYVAENGLVFAISSASPKRGALDVIPKSGGTATRIDPGPVFLTTTPGATDQLGFDVSKDGLTVFYSRMNELFMSSVTAPAPVPVSLGEAFAHRRGISPDGRLALYEDWSDSVWLYAQGGTRTKIDSHGMAGRFSADSKYVVWFGETPANELFLRAASATTGAPIPIDLWGVNALPVRGAVVVYAVASRNDAGIWGESDRLVMHDLSSSAPPVEVSEGVVGIPLTGTHSYIATYARDRVVFNKQHAKPNEATRGIYQFRVP